eukprot:4808970-Pleurochrysis_carterae.AAC.3
MAKGNLQIRGSPSRGESCRCREVRTGGLQSAASCLQRRAVRGAQRVGPVQPRVRCYAVLCALLEANPHQKASYACTAIATTRLARKSVCWTCPCQARLQHRRGARRTTISTIDMHGHLEIRLHETPNTARPKKYARPTCVAGLGLPATPRSPVISSEMASTASPMNTHVSAAHATTASDQTRDRAEPRARLKVHARSFHLWSLQRQLHRLQDGALRLLLPADVLPPHVRHLNASARKE